MLNGYYLYLKGIFRFRLIGCVKTMKQIGSNAFINNNQMKKTVIVCILLSALWACTKEKNGSTLKVTLISPANNSTVKAGTAVQFTWSASSSDITVPVTNKIKIVEIKGDESPDNAFKTNKPIFEKDSMNELSVNFPSSAGSPGFIAGKKYSWGVTARQKGLVSTGGTSSTSMFTVAP